MRSGGRPRSSVTCPFTVPETLMPQRGPRRSRPTRLRRQPMWPSLSLFQRPVLPPRSSSRTSTHATLATFLGGRPSGALLSAHTISCLLVAQRWMLPRVSHSTIFLPLVLRHAFGTSKTTIARPSTPFMLPTLQLSSPRPSTPSAAIPPSSRSSTWSSSAPQTPRATPNLPPGPWLPAGSLPSAVAPLTWLPALSAPSRPKK
mmetsp:Transcript_16735/g.49965  ORF Transcript_16735/g.49965 Transcript_16735/m.49965 type:complete len:202 (-) Transcript_16735:181-786(-)